MLCIPTEDDFKEECGDTCEWVIKDAAGESSNDSEEKQFFVEYSFNDYESDQIHDLSNVKLFLKLKDEKLEPTRITGVRGRGRRRYEN